MTRAQIALVVVVGIAAFVALFRTTRIEQRLAGTPAYRAPQTIST
jgi:hypothetical protein